MRVILLLLAFVVFATGKEFEVIPGIIFEEVPEYKYYEHVEYRIFEFNDQKTSNHRPLRIRCMQTQKDFCNLLENDMKIADDLYNFQNTLNGAYSLDLEDDDTAQISLSSAPIYIEDGVITKDHQVRQKRSLSLFGAALAGRRLVPLLRQRGSKQKTVSRSQQDDFTRIHQDWEKTKNDVNIQHAMTIQEIDEIRYSTELILAKISKEKSRSSSENHEKLVATTSQTVNVAIQLLDVMTYAKYLHTAALCVSGNLPLTAVSRDEFDYHYGEIMRRLPKELELLIPPGDTHVFFEQKFTVCGFEDGIGYGQVPIPVISNGQRFTLHRLQAISFRAGNRGSCMLKFTTSEFLYNKGTEDVIMLHDYNAPSCIDDTRFCKLPSTFMEDDEARCVKDLMRNTTAYSKYCKVVCSKNADPFVINAGKHIYASGIADLRIEVPFHRIVKADDKFGATRIYIPCTKEAISHQLEEQASADVNCVNTFTPDTLVVPPFFFQEWSLPHLTSMTAFERTVRKYEFTDSPNILQTLAHEWNTTNLLEISYYSLFFLFNIAPPAWFIYIFVKCICILWKT